MDIIPFQSQQEPKDRALFQKRKFVCLIQSQLYSGRLPEFQTQVVMLASLETSFEQILEKVQSLNTPLIRGTKITLFKVNVGSSPNFCVRNQEEWADFLMYWLMKNPKAQVLEMDIRA
mmetsp:Transcript_29221/g.38435  ORF Transcript_29221/g.38435 Transcript_29221/m.38435 type:complete len:118 (-) Transcript_29221:96-449(-)